MDHFARIRMAAALTCCQPTEAQAAANNYRKGRVALYGLKMAIETSRGTIRSGVDSSGNRWENLMKADYGHFEKYIGADGDGVDVFIGPWPESERVWIINQRNSKGGFDEHKVLLAFPDAEQAEKAYRFSYAPNWNGIMSIVPCTIEQLKWWLIYGNKAKPIEPSHLPYDGNSDMTDQNNAFDSALPMALYGLRQGDAEGLMLDAVTVADILEDSEGELALDALVIPFNKVERKMAQMQAIMGAAGNALSVAAMQVTPPFKQRGTTQVAGVFELSDGQTVSIFFHNPDTTPNKIKPTDDLVSWKWMLNKKDVTIVVAPEKGEDLNIREVARRIMRLAEKNSARFLAANTKKAEKLAAVESMKQEIAAKEAILEDIDLEIADLESKSASKAATAKLPKPSKLRDGKSDMNALEIEPDQLSALGVATITDIGSENIYMVKDGIYYFSKVMNTERYSVGKHDFAKHPEGTSDTPPAVVPEPAPSGTLADGKAALKKISPFLSGAQRRVMESNMKGEEGQFFIDKAIEMAGVIDSMPVTYGQDGMGDKAVAYLHYFKGSVDSYITEKDAQGDGTEQAFGYQDLGYGGELGYINIAELVSAGMELDLYWTPKTLGAIKGVEEPVAEPSPQKFSDSEIEQAVNALFSELEGRGWKQNGNLIYNGNYYVDLQASGVDGFMPLLRLWREGAQINGWRFNMTGKSPQELADAIEASIPTDDWKKEASAEPSPETEEQIRSRLRSRSMGVKGEIAKLGWGVIPSSTLMTLDIDGSLYAIKADQTGDEIVWRDQGSNLAWPNDPSLSDADMAAKIDTEFRDAIAKAKEEVMKPVWEQEGFDPTSPEGYAILKDNHSARVGFRDELDSAFEKRAIQTSRELLKRGWETAPGGMKVKGDFAVAYRVDVDMKGLVGERKVGQKYGIYSGKDLVNTIVDDLTKTPEHLAAQIDAIAQPAEYEYTARNEELGTEARVKRLDDGRLSVTLVDTDSGNVLPSAKIFPSDRRDDAIAYADTLVKAPVAEPESKAPPLGWTEATPGGMMTGKDPDYGGIVDKEIVSGKWFAVPNKEGIGTLEGFDTREQAYKALEAAVTAAIDSDAESEAQAKYEKFDAAQVKMPTATQLSLKALNKLNNIDYNGSTAGWTNGHIMDLTGKPKVVMGVVNELYDGDQSKMNTIPAAVVERVVNKAKASTNELHPIAFINDDGNKNVVLANEDESEVSTVFRPYFAYFYKVFKGAKFYGWSDLSHDPIKVVHNGQLVGLMMPVATSKDHRPTILRRAMKAASGYVAPVAAEDTETYDDNVVSVYKPRGGKEYFMVMKEGDKYPGLYSFKTPSSQGGLQTPDQIRKTLGYYMADFPSTKLVYGVSVDDLPSPDQGAPTTSDAENPDLVAAKQLMQSVIDGTADMADPELPTKLEAAYEKHQGDAEFDALFAQAVEAYSNDAINRAKQAL